MSLLTITVDFHDNPRHTRKVRNWRERIKKCDDVHQIVGTQTKHRTHYCHKIASIDIVEEQKIILRFKPVFRDTDLDELTLKLIYICTVKTVSKGGLDEQRIF